MTRFIVVEGPVELFSDIVEDLREDGRTVHEGFGASVGSLQGVVHIGHVQTDEDARDVVMCAVQGADIVAFGTAPRDVLDRLCDDLRRVGPLDHRVGHTKPSLTREDRELVRLLSAGMTLGDAATQLHISRRTADRRLAHIRTVLGVRTTAEALSKLSGA